MTTPASTTLTPRRWQHEPMLWMVIALPLLAVLGSAISVSLAFIHADTVLGDGARNDELSIRRDDSADAAARALGVSATLAADKGLWVVHLTPGSAALPDQLVVTLSDPHDPRNDQRLRYPRQVAHDYVGPSPHLRWHQSADSNPSQRVDIEIAPLDHSWRLLAQWHDGHFSAPAQP
jgi:uncharacterized protein